MFPFPSFRLCCRVKHGGRLFQDYSTRCFNRFGAYMTARSSGTRATARRVYGIATIALQLARRGRRIADAGGGLWGPSGDGRRGPARTRALVERPVLGGGAGAGDPDRPAKDDPRATRRNRRPHRMSPPRTAERAPGPQIGARPRIELSNIRRHPAQAHSACATLAAARRSGRYARPGLTPLRPSFSARTSAPCLSRSWEAR